jgi:hypothetical protein
MTEERLQEFTAEERLLTPKCTMGRLPLTTLRTISRRLLSPRSFKLVKTVTIREDLEVCRPSEVSLLSQEALLHSEELHLSQEERVLSPEEPVLSELQVTARESTLLSLWLSAGHFTDAIDSVSRASPFGGAYASSPYNPRSPGTTFAPTSPWVNRGGAAGAASPGYS